MRDFLKAVQSDIQSRMRDERDADFDDAFRNGYEEAAEICLGLLAKSIDELQSRLGKLSRDEQLSLSRMLELEKTTKEELGAPWSTRIGRRSEDAPKGRAT